MKAAVPAKAAKAAKSVTGLPGKAIGAFKRLPTGGKAVLLAIPAGILAYFLWERYSSSSAATTPAATTVPPATGGGPTFNDGTTRTIYKKQTKVVYRKGSQSVANHKAWQDLYNQLTNRIKRLQHYEAEARKHHNLKWLHKLQQRLTNARDARKAVAGHLDLAKHARKNPVRKRAVQRAPGHPKGTRVAV